MSLADLQMYPTVAGAVVPIYNIPARGGTSLVLTPVLLAKIFRGAVTMWDDPEIQALNNQSTWDMPANQTIEVV